MGCQEVPATLAGPVMLVIDLDGQVAAAGVAAALVLATPLSLPPHPHPRTPGHATLTGTNTSIFGETAASAIPSSGGACICARLSLPSLSLSSSVVFVCLPA